MAVQKPNLNKISDNSLSELSCLIGRIESLINRDFLHVEEYLPKSLVNEVTKFGKDIEKQIELREEENN